MTIEQIGLGAIIYYIEDLEKLKNQDLSVDYYLDEVNRISSKLKTVSKAILHERRKAIKVSRPQSPKRSQRIVP